MTTRRTMLTLAALLFTWSAAEAVAQGATTITSPTAQRFAWDHAAPADVSRFELRVDSGTFSDVGKTSCGAPLATSFCAPIPALAQGPHALTVRACNAAGCSAESAAVNVYVIVVPAAPSNARLVN